jgi:hypothetical protein
VGTLGSYLLLHTYYWLEIRYVNPVFTLNPYRAFAFENAAHIIMPIHVNGYSAGGTFDDSLFPLPKKQSLSGSKARSGVFSTPL